MPLLLPALLCAALVAAADYEPPVENKITTTDRALVAAAYASPGAPAIGTAWLLVVSVRDQRMVLAREGKARAVYTVSTARAGVGAKDGSGQTPPGWHRVSEWIGGDALPGQVFVARKPTEEVIPYTEWRSDATADKVLTRILWLAGLEPGRNLGGDVDSHGRFIYLHGTNQEHLLGGPASHGCIRMFNRDVMELYSLTDGQATYCLVGE